MNPEPGSAAARLVAHGEVAIRDATLADVERLWSLVNELARYERLEREGSAERLAASLFGESWPPIECLVAEHGDRLVGYAIFYGTYSTFATRPLLWLEDLFVAESHRGSGLGHALLSAVARVAVARACARMDWAVLDWNTPAIEFYERLGAKRHGGWDAYRVEGEELERLAADPHRPA